MNTVDLVKQKDRAGERGAALVMALMITSLLLIITAGLLMESSMNTYNVTDATAEQQAYNAAESGIQAALYVLRDNVTLPDSMRLDTTKPATDKANRINYVRALEPAFSNVGTTGLDAGPRLSRWLSYSTVDNDKIVMGGGTAFTNNGFAYDIKISDPDHTGKLVTFSAKGKFYDSEISNTTRKAYPNTTDVNRIEIEYLPKAAITVDTDPGIVATDFGSFRITRYGIGAAIPDNNRFEITVTMTQPYWGQRVLRGYVRPNSLTAGVWTVPQVYFDSKTYTIQGSQIALTSLGSDNDFGTSVYTEGPPAGFPVSLNDIAAVAGTATSLVQGTLSSPEPIRLVIDSTGYGPRGSVKKLQAIVQKNFFNGLAAPATLTLIGPPSTVCPPTCPATTFNFQPGSSTGSEYSGQDADSTDIIPPIGTLGQANLDVVHDSVDGQPPHPYNGEVVGVPTDITSDVPPWLASPENLDATIKSLKTVADSSGRYFANGVQPPNTGNFATGQGITFCDGNCEVGPQDGGGLLIVTGKLTLRGGFSFKGIIVVTGQGGIDRQGSGNAFIYGNVVIAPYSNSSVSPATEPAGSAFLAPQYDLSGGGTGGIQFSSTAVNDSLLAVNNFVLGVVEK
jgi:hypothetical protein